MDYYIYKIYCSDPFMKHLYVGSTNDFERRVQSHKNCSSFTNISIDHVKKLYSMIRAYGGWEHWKMEIIETLPCTDKQTAEEREQYYYETLNASLNSYPPMKDKTKEKFKCDKCSFVAYEKENLDKHKGNCWCYDEFKTNHPMLLLEQRIKEQQKEILELKQHKKETDQLNDDVTIFNCVHCSKVLANRRNLERHLKICKGYYANSLECPKCRITFTNRSAKSRHIKNVKCEPVEDHNVCSETLEG